MRQQSASGSPRGGSEGRVCEPVASLLKKSAIFLTFFPSSGGSVTSERVCLDRLGELRRTHACGDVLASLIGEQVVVAGWVQHRRDHGGVVFVDLRDRTGIVQVVFKPDTSPEAHERAGELRPEFVVLAQGRVDRRSDETINTAMPTGEVEILADRLLILNVATPPPFPIEEDAGVDESVRLRHRVHDLRRPPLQRALRLRHRLAQSLTQRSQR